MKDNSIFLISMWTAFLIEMLWVSILHKLQQVCKFCFMKGKTDDAGYSGVRIKVCNIVFYKYQLLQVLSEN